MPERATPLPTTTTLGMSTTSRGPTRTTWCSGRLATPARSRVHRARPRTRSASPRPQTGDNPTTVDDGNPGPTADGRRKPDLVAVGCGIESAQVGTACTTLVSPNCATSWATPHAAGAAALVRQYFLEGWSVEGEKVAEDAVTPSGSLIKAVLLNSTVNMSGVAGYPNDTEGWGLIRLERTLFFAGGRAEIGAWDVPHLLGLTTRQSGTHTINVAGRRRAAEDHARLGRPAAGRRRVRHARPSTISICRVTSPDGTRYVGNDFTDGVSTRNSVNIGDAINTVEMVVVDNPIGGDWAIEVFAARVAVGNPGQGYAVVATATTKAKRCFVRDDGLRQPRPSRCRVTACLARPPPRGGLAAPPPAMRVFAATYDRIGPLAARVRGTPAHAAAGPSGAGVPTARPGRAEGRACGGADRRGPAARDGPSDRAARCPFGRGPASGAVLRARPPGT